MQLWEMMKTKQNIPVSDPLAMLWGRRKIFSNFSNVTSAPPLTFNGVGGKTADYRIYGNTNGVGILNQTTGEYQIPVTVSNGEKSVTASIDIGNSPLDLGEYVSYQEQKIYKNVNIPITLPDASTTFYGVDISIENGIASISGTCQYDAFLSLYQGIVYLGTTAQTVAIQESHSFPLTKGRTYRFHGTYASGVDGYVGILVGKLGASMTNGYNPAQRILNNGTFTVEADNIYCMPVFQERPNESYDWKFSPFFSYAVPFPARLPQLVTLSGTNTLSFGTTVQPEKIYLKYGTS